MNIWYISKYAVTPELGSATRQFFISKYFAKLGHKTTLISSQSASIKNHIKQDYYFVEKQIDGISHVLLKGKKIQLGFSFLRIMSWIFFEYRLLRYAFTYKGNKPDCIIVSSLSILTFISGVILKWRYKTKLIVEVRDIWPLSLYEIADLSKYNPFAFVLSQIEKFGYMNADGIVGTMPNLDKHIKTVLNKEFKFKCIPMGYDSEYLNEGAYSLPDSHIIQNEKFVICYAGTIGKVNLVDQILEAAKILKEQSYKFHFAILGDGPLKQKLENEYKDVPCVKFYDALPKKLVNPFLKQCDLLIHPVPDLKIYEYGISPNKWIDYMLSGKPILVPYSGYQSMINEAGCGFFIPPENPKLIAQKIEEISLIKKEHLVSMGENGKEYVQKNHKYEILAKRFLEFINHV